MVWDQLSINKPHLVYIILGGFTSIFMLCSLVIKEKLYIGEASVATVVGLIFGPHAANLIDPADWGNTDQITLEFSRIVLVVQCFAVGVELPKSYMERHWKSVVMLLVPVMTYGWLVTSLFIWWMIEPLTWLESLCVAACVTATDPVLASSVVGKGKFAKRVPKHIRDLLSAESGCNDGMAFPFIYLPLYLLHYHLDAAHVSFHWICYTILYECIWGAVYGVLVGYAARRAIRFAEGKGYIDRESFLVFYFVLALFCAGSGAMLGMDDLLIGFAAGVGFSNDGWFTEKTEESHVSNVIDLLLNLTYFVYLGTIIPWDQFNSGVEEITVWRLVVIAIFVLLFRRIPIMLAMKPFIPDIKTWREALFCGHFGPIGVGAIFVAILARAELETGSTTPLAAPDPASAEYVLIYTIWPVVTFLVISSILVHGSSIAVFTLGKRINTLTLTMSFTQDNDYGSNWMQRLPRISSSRSQGLSFSSDRSDWSDDEKEKMKAPSGLAIPKLVLRRQQEDDVEKRPRSSSKNRTRRRKRKHYEDGMGPGGPISQSAIMPARRSAPNLSTQESNSDTLNEKSEQPSPERGEDGPLSPEQLEQLRSGESDSDGARARRRAKKEAGKDTGRQSHPRDNDVDVEVYDEGDELIVEDVEGNVIKAVPSEGMTPRQKHRIVSEAKDKIRNDEEGYFARHKHEPHAENEEEEIEHEIEDAVTGGHEPKGGRGHFRNWKGWGKKDEVNEETRRKKEPERKRGPAHAYMYGNTVVIEDEDGEVIKEYTIPKEQADGANYSGKMREGMARMGTWVGIDRKKSQVPVGTSTDVSELKEQVEREAPVPDEQREETTPAGEKPPQSSSKRPGPQRRNTTQDSTLSDDDGLRLFVSRTQTYGLTGLQKPKPGERPDVLQSQSRRMSTRDFMKHLQTLNEQSKRQAMQSDKVDEDVKQTIRGSLNKEDDTTPNPKRTNTMPHQSARAAAATPSHEGLDTDDYFSTKSAPRTRGRAQSDLARREPEQQGSRESSPEGDIPTHNVRDSVSRHGKGTTAADRRRQRYESNVNTAAAAAAPTADTITEDDAEDDDPAETAAERRRRLAAIGEKSQSSSSSRGGQRSNEEDNADETAAEKRRRLAALGIGASGAESSSDSEDEGPRQPRRTKTAIQEPDQTAPMRAEPVAQTQQPRMRIQWGGETRSVGRGEETGDQTGRSGGLGQKLKGFVKK